MYAVHIRAHTQTTTTPSLSSLPPPRLFVVRERSPRSLGTQSISVPRLPARHNYFTKRTDFATITSRASLSLPLSLFLFLSPGEETEQKARARACSSSAEEIFLTARCHRVRPTEITDEDNVRSSTSVTVQERERECRVSPAKYYISYRRRIPKKCRKRKKESNIFLTIGSEKKHPNFRITDRIAFFLTFLSRLCDFKFYLKRF